MPTPKRLTLFVEGEADTLAAPVLIKRILNERAETPWDTLVPDDLPPFEVGHLSGLMGLDKRTKAIHFKRWINYLERARRTRKNLGGVLLLLDGDLERVAGKPFCPGAAGRMLAEAARQEGGGTLFSVGIVFLRMEYESIFLAGFDSLGGRKQGIPAPDDVENKRGAREWLNSNLVDGYHNVSDQIELTRQVDFTAVRQRMTSFRRLERVIDQFVTAFRSDNHILSPSPASNPRALGAGS